MFIAALRHLKKLKSATSYTFLLPFKLPTETPQNCVIPRKNFKA